MLGRIIWTHWGQTAPIVQCLFQVFNFFVVFVRNEPVRLVENIDMCFRYTRWNNGRHLLITGDHACQARGMQVILHFKFPSATSAEIVCVYRAKILVKLRFLISYRDLVKHPDADIMTFKKKKNVFMDGLRLKIFTSDAVWFTFTHLLAILGLR